MEGPSGFKENGVEQEPVVDSKVILEFFRHGNKEKMAGPDEQIILSEKGREQAQVKGQVLSPRSEVSLGFGSPRIRTQETAYRIMLANEDIVPDMSLEEIKKRISDEMGMVHMKKMIEDDRLNFALSGQVDVEGVQAYNEGRYLDWMLKESDTSARKYKDMTSTVYTRQVAGIAELCKRYLSVGAAFNRLVAKTNKYEEQNNQLERYMGTHGGVVDSFVSKILEVTKGTEERDKFLDAVGPGGFAETQGIRVEINNHGNEQSLTFHYPAKEGEIVSDKSVMFGQQVLDSLIAERQAFDAEIAKED